MTLSELCIRRPVMTTLITASIIAFGVFGFRLLPVSALPRVDFPTIAVTATLPGASADTMAASVAGIIERQLSTIAGISSMSSSSSQGTTQITIQFDLNRNIDAASLDVQTALTIAQRRLPIEMTIPPSFRKVNPADFPVLFVSLGSATLPLSAVNEYGDITIGQSLSQIPGVAQVLIFGAQKFAIRVQADPEAAAARGLSLEDIRAAVARANSSTPVGTLNGPKQDVALQASGQMDKAADYHQIVVAWRNGSPVKLDEVARIYDSVENDKIASWLNDERSIVLGIQKQPDANTVAVVDSLLAKLPALRAQIPPPVDISVYRRRYLSAQCRQFRQQGIHHRDRVGIRLLLNAQHDGTFVVQPARDLVIFHAVVDSRDFVEFDRRTVAPRHHDLMVVGRLVHLPGGLKGDVLLRSVQRSDRGRGVGARDRGANVFERQP